MNDLSDKNLAPHLSTYELGNVIPRLIWQMALAPDTGVPILFSKIDLNDGYVLEVYIEDFIALIHTTDREEITRLTRSLLHAITDIFPPLEINGSSIGPAISEKKLIAEGTWETRKEILGWVVDGIARAIELHTKKCDKILAELCTARRSKTLRVSDLKRSKANSTSHPSAYQ